MVFERCSLVWFVFAGAVCLIISACDSADDGFTETYSYTFQDNKQIVVDTTHQQFGEDSTRSVLTLVFPTGNNLVFHYKFNQTAPPEIMDGGFAESIFFEIPSGSQSIDLSGEDLKQAGTFYARSCFCPRIGAIEVDSGYIKGKKMSEGFWQVSASVGGEIPYGKFEVEFDDVFMSESNL